MVSIFTEKFIRLQIITGKFSYQIRSWVYLIPTRDFDFYVILD